MCEIVHLPQFDDIWCWVVLLVIILYVQARHLIILVLVHKLTFVHVTFTLIILISNLYVLIFVNVPIHSDFVYVWHTVFESEVQIWFIIRIFHWYLYQLYLVSSTLFQSYKNIGCSKVIQVKLLFFTHMIGVIAQYILTQESNFSPPHLCTFLIYDIKIINRVQPTN